MFSAGKFGLLVDARENKIYQLVKKKIITYFIYEISGEPMLTVQCKKIK